MVSIPDDEIWIVVVGFIIAFILAIGIGANDVANTFGTSVGAKVLTLKQACILATIFETAGAILLGAKVSDTVRKGILDVEAYHNDTQLFMVGNVAALAGSGAWLIVATILKLPVSGTHSIIGAILGFTLVAKGARGVSWATLGTIIGSWFVSPVLSGIVSTAIFLLCKYCILNKLDPLEPGLRFLPIFYGFTVVINVFSIFYEGPELLGFDRIPLWGTFILCFGMGIIVGVCVRLLMVPWQRKKITNEVEKLKQEELEQGAQEIVKTEVNGDIVKPENEFTSTVTHGAEMQNGHITNGHAKFNQAFENSEEAQEVHTYAQDHDHHHKRPRQLSVLSVRTIPEDEEMEDEAPPSSPTRIKQDIITRIRRRSRTRSNTEDSLTLTDNEEIDAYLGLDDSDEESNEVPPSSQPAQPTGEFTEVPLKVDQTSINVALENGHSYLNEGAEIATEAKDTDSRKSDTETDTKTDATSDTQTDGKQKEDLKDRPETARLFSFLQILTAIFGAFAHGGNDVSNAIGPVVSIWLVATTGEIAGKAATPVWILFIGGVGISIGLWVWGRRVIETMGEDLSTVTPSSGFCIEIGAATTVLIASNIGIPISSTHCKVGSIVFVGRTRSKSNVDWKLFRNIVLAWIITLPASGLVSAALMACLQFAV